MRFFSKEKLIIASVVIISISARYFSYKVMTGLNYNPQKQVLYKNVEIKDVFSQDLYEKKRSSENKENTYARNDQEIVISDRTDDKNNNKDDLIKDKAETKYVMVYGRNMPIYTEEEVAEMNKSSTNVSIVFNEEDYYADGVVNINIATKEELMELKGVDEKLADNIIACRNKKGAFIFTHVIKEAEGMTDEIYEGIKDVITVSKMPRPKNEGENKNGQ